MHLPAKFSLARFIQQLFSLRWRPNHDLTAVGVSWLLVTGALYVATHVVGSQVAGGMAYFFLYGVLTATVFGLGIPLYWMVAVRHQPLASLGLSTRWLGVSVLLQVVFAILQFIPTLGRTALPPLAHLLPLVALSLAIGLFEAVFWRGWVQLRLENAFGILPAIVIGSLLYALYHIGYGMPMSEIGFLFIVGVIYAAAFRLTKSIFILWPLLQPMGQLVTLVRDGLSLPLLATLGFIEVFAVMALFIWLAQRYYRRRVQPSAAGPTAALA